MNKKEKKEEEIYYAVDDGRGLEPICFCKKDEVKGIKKIIPEAKFTAIRVKKGKDQD